MAQQYTTSQGLTLTDPGTYVFPQVINNTSGIAAAGVITLLGEAFQGPDFTKESNLDANAFGPSDISLVQQKYGSGNLVDAFRSVIAAANDPAIVGSVSLVKLVKTNPSVAASAAIARSGFGSYSTLTAASEGTPGNNITYSSQVSVAEVAPSTGPFAYVPHYSSTPVAFSLRTNGGAQENVSVPEFDTGSAFCTLVESYADGILAQGGATVLPLNGNVGTNISAATVGGSSTQLVITLSGAFGNVPAAGDTIVIPLSGDYGTSGSSVLIGASNANRGAYLVNSVVPGVSTSTLTVTRINAPSGAPAVVAVSATPVVSAANDLIDFQSVEISNFTGQNRQSLVGLSGTFNWTVTGSIVVMTAPFAWAAQPNVGDNVVVPTAFGTLSAGFYTITAATATTATFARLSNGSAGSSGSQSVGSPIVAGSEPFTFSKPVIDGLGKSLEIVGSMAPIAYIGSSQIPATFGNSLLVSAAEYENSFVVSNPQVSNTYLSGGDIAIEVGCSQANATVVIGATTATFKVGANVIFSVPYAQFTTLSVLASYISSQPTFSASVPLPKLANLSPSLLDRGTYGISASLPLASDLPGRIKNDANEFESLVGTSALVTAVNDESTFAGLPEVISPPLFLHGGTLAGTTSQDFVAAIDACQNITTNFMVPLISQDASLDIAAGLTDPSSTYTVDAVNDYLKSHVLLMSEVLTRQNRQAIVSREGAYETQQLPAAQTLGSFRVSMSIEDVMVVNSQGLIQQYQPWMGSVVAAGMQAAAGFKGIVKKFANVSGIVKPQGDWSPSNSGNRISALEGGIFFMEKVPTGGFRWASDQTTYTVDNNFVYNSLQAVYLSDLMTLTLIQSFDTAVVGKSVAEISAAGALSFLDGQMSNFLRLKWIAPSDDAPKGYKNASVVINGGVMLINVEVKLAGLLYFVPITFSISQVQQSASQAG